MATLLMQHYSPAPRQGILLNSSPAASPAYHPACLPALIPSNTSLSSSASSSGPGEASDYFTKSASPSPGPSHGSPAPRNAHLHPSSKPRNGSNPSTVRRIRFAPLPEPRRDDDPESEYPAVFVDDDDTVRTSDHILSMSSALAAVSCPLPPSVPSSPMMGRKALPPPGECLLLDHSYSQSSSDSSEPGPETPHPTKVPSDLGHDWEAVAPAADSLPALSLNLALPDSPRKGGKWTKMLNPFKGRSHSNKTSPLARTFSKEEAAAINGEAQRGRSAALRAAAAASSRNSSISREPSLNGERRDADFGMPLHRWTSEGAQLAAAVPLSKKKKLALFGGSSSSNGGVALGRTQSLTSLSGKDDKKVIGAKARPAVQPNNGGRRQQRMLNGRVYGARKNKNPNANPFANVRTDEPEFVEWGYGGMGSVKTSAGQSSIWQRVQAGDDAAGLARRNTEEDDGSGLAWARRRKEQREREKREREEREKEEAAKQASGEAVSESPVEEASEQVSEETVQVLTESPESHTEDSDKATVEPQDAPTSPTAVPLPASNPSTPSAYDAPKPEHIMQAINIPAPSPHRHHHSHSHSHSLSHAHHGHHHTLSVPYTERRESGETVRVTPVSSPTKAGVVTPDVAQVPVSEGARSQEDVEAERAERESVGSSAASTTSGEGDVEYSPKDTDGGFGQDEEDEEDEEIDQGRLTAHALGAGVEKIARHHKEEQQSTASQPVAEASS